MKQNLPAGYWRPRTEEAGVMIPAEGFHMVWRPFFLGPGGSMANEQRERTTEQKAREFARLKAIEQERAKERMSQGGQGGVKEGQENFPDLGDARDLAAQRVAKKSGNHVGKNSFIKKGPRSNFRNPLFLFG